MNALQQLAKTWGMSDDEMFVAAVDTGCVSDNCSSLDSIWGSDAAKASRFLQRERKEQDHEKDT